MNYWLDLSIQYANQRSYLDDLFQVYPTIPEGIRTVDSILWKEIEKAFKKRDNPALLENILKLDLFPLKDSYVAYLKRDKAALKRNPATAARLCGHQNAQFNDAIATIKTKNVKAIKAAILDGVLYIKGNNKMYNEITTRLKKENIMSSLVFREFLYQI